MTLGQTPTISFDFGWPSGLPFLLFTIYLLTFSFITILDLEKNCGNDMEVSPIFLAQFIQLAASYISMVHPLQLTNKS